MLWPIHNGILGYTGFTILPPFAAWMPARVSAAERQAYLDAFAERLRSIDRIESTADSWDDHDSLFFWNRIAKRASDSTVCVEGGSAPAQLLKTGDGRVYSTSLEGSNLGTA